MSKPPFAWLRKISPELPPLDAIPLFGKSPPFDWERLSSLLATRFGVTKLSINKGEQAWRTEQELRKDLGPNPTVMPIALSPIGGGLFWIMSRGDIAKLTSWMLNGKARVRSVSSELLQEGFYRYLLLESLDALQGMQPIQDLTPQMGEESQLPETDAFCIDVEIVFDQSSCWGRLAVTPDFRKSWVQHFAKFPHEYVPTELARQTMLTIGIKTGSVLLHQNEWKKIKKGDFVLLDKGSYDARKGTGAATIMLGQTPLFNTRIKQNKIELLDYAFYYEENMEQKSPGQNPKPANEPSENPIEESQPAEGEVVSLKEMPLYVTVELARLRITLEKLMQLNPGNMLDLPLSPDQSVSLTVNGQTVGKAELVYLGEALGLRILEIG